MQTKRHLTDTDKGMDELQSSSPHGSSALLWKLLLQGNLGQGRLAGPHRQT